MKKTFRGKVIDDIFKFSNKENSFGLIENIKVIKFKQNNQIKEKEVEKPKEEQEECLWQHIKKSKTG